MLALATTLLLATAAAFDGSSEELKEWYKSVNDVNFACSDFDPAEVAEKPIFSVVDCDADCRGYRQLHGVRYCE